MDTEASRTFGSQKYLLWGSLLWTDEGLGSTLKELVRSFPFPDMSLVLQWIFNELSSSKNASELLPESLPCSNLDLALQKEMSDAGITFPQVSI